jgi:glycosyltransferase involved in cell wall biosynthesis
MHVERMARNAGLSVTESSTPPTVAVLMATYNGGDFLDEQIQSLEDQTHASIDVHVSDDGSSDRTRAILEAWRARWNRGRFVVRSGPGGGFSENFRSLIVHADVDADYFAFCDQDDIWEPGKLRRALETLGPPADAPRLFCSRTRIISESGRLLGLSPEFRRDPSFRNALVQSIAGGNTMVFNAAARHLLATASARSAFVSHDWWAYMLVTGAGGQVFYSSEPLVRYRQHPNNLVGTTNSIRGQLDRLERLGRGVFAQWSDINIAGLEDNIHLLTPEARTVFGRFKEARNKGIAERLRGLRASGVYRQTLLGNIALYVAAMFGRL